MRAFLSILVVLFVVPQLGAQKRILPSVAAKDRVEVVVFSDFQCPFCAGFAQPIRQLQSTNVDGIALTVQFKHFPLNIHPASVLVHQAALAAQEQGKFWEMHDLLFAHQSTVERNDLLRYAIRLGLNLDRFKQDLDSPRIRQLIDADISEGVKLQVQATPSFLINGTLYSGAHTFDQLKQLVLYEQRRMHAIAELPDNLMNKGPVDAPVTVELFADLQSPVTRPAIQILDQALRKYPSKVRLQFRNFPLSFHPQAALAHQAAMAAARHGHFWDFATYILDHQDSLREQDLIAYAGRLGLDQLKFAETIQQHWYALRVAEDVSAGFKRGIRGSPVVFVNGKRIDGVPSFQLLTNYVEEALAAQAAKQDSRQ
jgi:protein-disulfide isomerase